jgi:2-C-methyl-D-erythritol 4-phosphate cytidylyltransferase
MIDVIYLAAGKGVRAKLGYPKQYARLGGKPIMIHGLDVLQGMAEIQNIIIPSPAHSDAPEVLSDYIYNKKIIVVEGGVTRQLSVKAGLREVKTDEVLICEAVRPFITPAFVRSIIEVEAPFVTPWINPKSTVIDTDGIFYDRDMIGEVQMPQKYETRLLRQAHNLAFDDNYTDDAALVMSMTEVTPVIVPGMEENIKITTPLDLKIAEAIYKYRTEGKNE